MLRRTFLFLDVMRYDTLTRGFVVVVVVVVGVTQCSAIARSIPPEQSFSTLPHLTLPYALPRFVLPNVRWVLGASFFKDPGPFFVLNFDTPTLSRPRRRPLA